LGVWIKPNFSDALAALCTRPDTHARAHMRRAEATRRRAPRPLRAPCAAHRAIRRLSKTPLLFQKGVASETWPTFRVPKRPSHLRSLSFTLVCAAGLKPARG
jgi:hypothetical protein